MVEILLPLIIVGFLAYSNGANDNFKGVATLFGSHTTNYKTALAWASLTTFLGSLAALFLASELIVTFSGKGLVPDMILANPLFSLAVALSSALTVWIATLLGFPISTTHAITGALVGTGFVASHVSIEKLGKSFFLPLAVSPIIAFIAAIIFYYGFRKFRLHFGITKETCICVGSKIVAAYPSELDPSTARSLAIMEHPTLEISTEVTCQKRYSGFIFGLNLNKLVDLSHYASAGSVCFARALNDTPKIAAILILTKSFSLHYSLLYVAILMLVGGILSARKVAEMMSLKVTEMNSGQGFTGNLVTSLIVIFASKWGVPVSTTHVSCGALFGIGTVNGQAHWKTILSIVVAWITTLPVAAMLGGICWFFLRYFKM